MKGVFYKKIILFYFCFVLVFIYVCFYVYANSISGKLSSD